MLRLPQAEVRRPELNLQLQHGEQESKQLSCHLLPLKVCISRELELEGDQDLNQVLRYEMKLSQAIS